MAMRVVINGFGRMGKLLLRASWDMPELEIIHINELVGDAQTIAHLLEFDSVHGRWDRAIEHCDTAIMIDGKSLSVSHSSKIEGIPWGQLGADLVLECTGAFRNAEDIDPYYQAGLKKVLVAAPVKSDRALNIVMGINDDLYDPDRHNLITAASCTTNCLAPVVKVVHENIGIVHGSITTIHDITNTQTIVDAPHKDLRRARSALNSLIPTSTGSATAITMIYPELAGKLNGHAIRVPILNASLTDCVFEVSRDTTIDEVNTLFETAAKTELKGILGYEERPLVSSDYVNDPRSCIIDAASTMVVDKRQVKIFAWYDNEWGYVNRMAELARKIAL
jgi:glyceraldehyde 3-phosphate dehydrogenase